ncbi:MAG: ABC transporter permease [Candidatus Acetothermia bacterium]|jgi:simple sugar transport system permease protein|nr:ABC transporter permease [Candidatus Acetothermia bacterium]MDH7504655.1 ABC transporter permease [Candidatus Acetothermia bacterium]
MKGLAFIARLRRLKAWLFARLIGPAARAIARLRPLWESLLAGLIGLAVGAIIMLIYHFNPIQAYFALFRGSFGTVYSLSEALANATPLILTGLTFAIGLRGGLFNIGAEGQVYIGALAAIALSLFKLPAGLHLIVTLLAGMLAGALWSLPAAILKIARGVHEVISTIMFNWIAHFLSFYLIANILVDPRRAEKTISILPTARFPVLMPRTSLSYGILVSIFFVGLVLFLLWYTTIGFEVRAMGFNPAACRYAGIKRWRTALFAFVMGGFTAGLAGAVDVMGRPPSYAIFSGLGGLVNLGFNGLGVAMIGRNHPVGIVLAAIFFGGLMAGGRLMQISPGVPLELIRVVEGAIIITLAVPELIRIFRLFRGKLLIWRRA